MEGEKAYSMEKIHPRISRQLVNLGLSEKEVSAYLTLLREGALSASQLGRKIGVLPNAVYRLAESLIEKGFVVDLGGRPRRFQARPPETAFGAFLVNQTATIQKAKIAALESLSEMPKRVPQTRVDLVTGQAEVFAKAVEMYNRTRKEILIISIGEPIPEDLLLSMRDALERKVKIEMIAHKYDEENKALLSSWKRMGMKIRHYPDWGFHLSICDAKRVLLTVNNPENTKERTGIMFGSPALAKAMRDYFYSVWEKAEEIS